MIYQLTQTGDQVQTILDQAPTTEQSLQEEITRSTGKDEQLETAIGNEKTRAEGVEANLQTAIGNEKTRAEGAEGNLQTAIGNEKTRAELVEGGLRTDVDGINAKIPTGASSENKLATQSFVNSSVATATADFKGTYNSLEALETAVHDANANDYAFVISTDAAGNTVYNRYKYVDGTGWVFEYALNNSSFTSAQWAAINSAITAALVAKLTGLPTATELTTQLNAIIDSVATEKSRAEGIESGLRTDVNANATAIGTEKTRAEGAEGNLSTAIGNEKTRAEAAELLLQQNINAEALLRGNADTALQTSIDGINAKIPAAASASNQLADKTFVNSSIATNTATFRGTYNSVEALDEVTADNNDYAFVVATDTAGNTVYNRYKYVEGSGWVFEYALNNSSFTATQWAAVNSGITAALVTKLDGLPDNTALTAMFTAITSLIPAAATSDNKLVDYAQLVAGLATKQNTLTFDNAPTENSSNPVKSGGVYTAIATVTAAIVGLQSSKQDVLTFDQYPTAGSNNPVKSTGIYTAIENAVAPKANQTALDAETTRATNAESGLSTRISTNAADIASLQAAYAGLTQNDVVVVATTDTWPVSNPQQNVIYRVVDRVNTPPQYYSDYMWNGSAMVLMAQYDNAIDDMPTYNSDNLAKSDGIFKMTQEEANNGNILMCSLEGCRILDNTWYDSDGFISRSNSQMMMFKAAVGQVLKVKRNSNNFASIVFANEELTSLSGNTIFETGVEELEVPEGKPIVIVGLKYNGGNRKPALLSLNDVELINSVGISSYVIRKIAKSGIYTVHFDTPSRESSTWNKTYLYGEVGDIIYIRKRNNDGDYLTRAYNGEDLMDFSQSWKPFEVNINGMILITSPANRATSFDIDITFKKPDCCYVSPSGNDANIGTESSPYKTLAKGLMESDNIILREGEYDDVQIDLSKFDSRDIHITAYPAEKPIIMNRTIIVGASEESSTTGYTNVYQKTVDDPSKKWIFQHLVNDENTAIDDAETHPLQRGLFYRCDCTKIERLTFGSGETYTTLAEALAFMDSEVANNNYYYVYDNGVIYFTRPETVTAAHPICCSKGATVTGQNKNNRLNVSGVSFYYGSVILNDVDNSQFSDCASKYAANGGCFSWQNCKNLTFRKCEAARSQYNQYGDGFSGNASTLLDPITASVYLMDCWSHDNYDDGYSDHGGCNINIYGGLYEYNGKGGTTPSYGSHCCGRDILSRHNRYGIYYTGYGEQMDTGKNGNATFFNCVSHNNREAGFYVYGGEGNTNVMFCYNCISYNNVGYGYQGKIYAYNCKEDNNTAGDKSSTVIVQSLNELQ